MPCYDNRSSPEYEREQKRQLFEKAFNQLWDVSITDDVQRCALMRRLQLTERELFESKLYNGRDANARKVADWWETHQLNDIREHESLVARMRNVIIPPVDGSAIIVHLFVGPEVLLFRNSEQSGGLGIYLLSKATKNYTEFTAVDTYKALREAWPASDVVVLVSHRTGKLGSVVNRVELYDNVTVECDVASFAKVETLHDLRTWIQTQRTGV